MSAILSQKVTTHGPYAPTTASLGSFPTVGVDVPICAVLIAIYVGAATGHMTIFQLNRRRNHVFVFSALMFGFCMARIVTLSLRIAWACHLHNVRLAMAANIFVNVGVLILFIVDILLALRIFRATHPHFGWHRTVTPALAVVFALLILLLAMLITAVVQSSYTLDSNIHHIDRHLMMTGISYILFFSFLPIPIIVLSLLLPRRGDLDNFGSGTFRTKIIIVLVGTTILLLGSSFRAATMYKNPRAITDPAWYDAKWAFYFFNFILEIIVIYLYLVTRVDLRFHVPDGAKGPGDYARGQSEATKIISDGADSNGTPASLQEWASEGIQQPKPALMADAEKIQGR